MTPAAAGLGVLLTRPDAQSGPLMRRLEALGMAVHTLPVLSITSFSGPGLEEALDAFPSAHCAVFVSAHAVHEGVAALARHRLQVSAGPLLAAVGQATAHALTEAGAGKVLCAGAGSDSEALLGLPALQAVTGRTVILFRGESATGGRTLLRDTLRARGARVLEAICYRRASAPLGPEAVRAVCEALSRRRIQAVQVMSRESLTALLSHLPIDSVRQATMLVPHPRIAEAAESLGIPRVRVVGFGDDEWVAAFEALARESH